MRLLLAIHNFPPEFTGGTERVVLALAGAYQRLGHEVAVLAGSERPRAAADVVEERGTGIRVLRVPRTADEPYGLDLRRPRLAAVVDGCLAQLAPELLHVHHWSTLHQGLVRQAAARRVRVGITLHDLWAGCPRFFRRPPQGIRCPEGAGRDSCVECIQRDLPLPEAALRDALATRDQELRAELHAARFVSAPSAAAEARLRLELGLRAPLQVVPHGLLEPAGERATAPEPGQPFRIGTFGNLLREKGVDLLLEACAGLPDVELHLSGAFLEQGLEAALRERARELRVALVVHGAFGPADPHPATRLHLAVFPSLCHETYGLVVDEALARGVPVVVSDRGALGERIGKGGLVVRGGIEPLRVALARVRREPGLYPALRAGVPAQLGSIDDAARRYLELFGVTA